MERQNSVESMHSKSRQQQIAEELMAVRLREAESVADLKNMKQKVMELETQVIYSFTYLPETFSKVTFAGGIMFVWLKKYV